MVRTALFGLILVGLSAALPTDPEPSPSATAGVTTTERLNVLVIMTDDQRADTLSYLPTVTGMGGTTFTHAFATTSLCCPARAAFLTGQYAHNSGVWSNRTDGRGWEAMEDQAHRTLPVWLRHAGYRTGLFGKYLNHYPAERRPRGWTVVRNAMPWYGPERMRANI